MYTEHNTTADWRIENRPVAIMIVYVNENWMDK